MGAYYLYIDYKITEERNEKTSKQSLDYLKKRIKKKAKNLETSLLLLQNDASFITLLETGNNEEASSLLNSYSLTETDDFWIISSREGSIEASSFQQGESTALTNIATLSASSLNYNEFSTFNGKVYKLVTTPIESSSFSGAVSVGFPLDSVVTDSSIILVNNNFQFFQLTNDGNANKNIDISPNSITTPIYENDQEQIFALENKNNAIIEAVSKHRKNLIPFAILSLTLILIAALISTYISTPLKALHRVTKSIDNDRQTSVSNSIRRYTETSAVADTLTSSSTKVKSYANTFKHASRYDRLTKILNYQTAIETLETNINEKKSFIMMHLALHHLRSINGSFGYETGDQYILVIANRLSSLASTVNQLFRLHHNEFLIIIDNNVVDKNWLDLFFKTLTTPVLIYNNTTINPSFSIGQASHPIDGTDTQTLLRRADIALQQARNNGAKIEIYTDELNKIYRRKETVVNGLKKAIANNELWMDYQPKLDIETGEVKHFEALMRWYHPTLGLIPADEFIELAERSGNMHVLSQWMISTVFQQLHIWKQRGHLLSVAINLSTSDLTDQALPKKLLNLFTTYEIEPWQLSIEITESTAMQDIKTTIKVLDGVSDLGILLAIDDFGTGYSSLAQLKRLPVNELKIDKAFILQLYSENSNLAIVRSTIDLGHLLGLKIIAEGVEDFETATILANMKCDYIQGYWLSKPMPAHQVTTWLHNFKKIFL